MVIVKTKDLTFRKGLIKKREILSNINITLKDGEKVAVYGRTASGKTALLNIISGLLDPTSGKVERIGSYAYSTQAFLLYEDLTVMENIDFACAVNNFKHKDIKQFLSKTGLAGWEKVQAKSLPEGLRKMLQIACSFSKDFDFIMIDEPTLGLDYHLKITVWQMIDEAAAAGKGILIATAVEDDIAHCDKIYNLDDMDRNFH